MSERNSTAMVGAVMLVVGGILGAGVALLYAPQSGAKTRKGIAKFTKRARRRGEEVVEDFTDQVTEMAEAVGDRAAEILDKGTEMACGAKKGILKAMEDAEERLVKERSRLAKMFG